MEKYLRKRGQSHSVLEDVCQVSVGSANHQIMNAFNDTGHMMRFPLSKNIHIPWQGRGLEEAGRK